MDKCEYNDAQLCRDICTVLREPNITEEIKVTAVLEARAACRRNRQEVVESPVWPLCGTNRFLNVCIQRRFRSSTILIVCIVTVLNNSATIVCDKNT
jgi:hypothetical protein